MQGVLALKGVIILAAVVLEEAIVALAGAVALEEVIPLHPQVLDQDLQVHHLDLGLPVHHHPAQVEEDDNQKPIYFLTDCL